MTESIASPTASVTDPSLADTPPRRSPPVAAWRRLLAGGAVLSCLPYLVIKVLWLAGSDLGLADDRLVHDTAMEVANTVTALMSLCGAVIAVLLVRRDRLRLPGSLVVAPMFVGTGLLGGILVLIPIQSLIGARGSQQPTQPDDPIAGWVYAMVYGGFSLLGLCLLGLFAAYAGERWLGPWRSKLADAPPAPRRAQVVAIAHGCFMVVVCIAEAVLVARAERLGGHQVLSVLMASVCLLGLTLLAIRRPAGRSGVVPLGLVFLGSAAVASWGLFFLVMFSVPNPLVGERDLPAALLVVEALRAVNGALTLVAIDRLRPHRNKF